MCPPGIPHFRQVSFLGIAPNAPPHLSKIAATSRLNPGSRSLESVSSSTTCRISSIPVKVNWWISMVRGFRIDNPKFFDSGPCVLLLLVYQIQAASLWRKNLNDKLRRTLRSFLGQISSRSFRTIIISG